MQGAKDTPSRVPWQLADQFARKPILGHDTAVAAPHAVATPEFA